MRDHELVEKAAQIAITAHAGQFRKGGDSVLYATHPVAVALMLARHGFSDVVLAAALVHDVLEDTDLSEAQLREELGEEVFAVVKAVSENKSLPWEERKRQYIESVRRGSEEVKAVSVADKIHNLESLKRVHAKLGEGTWSRFTLGKDKQVWFAHEMLSMFRDTWQHPLVDEYETLIRQLEELV